MDLGFSLLDGKGLQQVVGSPYYMAPEVCAAYKNDGVAPRYSEKVDVWGLGAIAFVLLCGYPPWNGGGGAPGAPGAVDRIVRDVLESPLRFDGSIDVKYADGAREIERRVPIAPRVRRVEAAADEAAVGVKPRNHKQNHKNHKTADGPTRFSSGARVDVRQPDGGWRSARVVRARSPDEGYWDHVSPDAVALLRRMLEKDPERRCSMRDVLASDWVKRAQSVDPEPTRAAVERLRRLHLRGLWRGAALARAWGASAGHPAGAAGPASTQWAWARGPRRGELCVE
jgi:serine/threonine protein kinase